MFDNIPDFVEPITPDKWNWEIGPMPLGLITKVDLDKIKEKAVPSANKWPLAQKVILIKKDSNVPNGYKAGHVFVVLEDAYGETTSSFPTRIAGMSIEGNLREIHVFFPHQHFVALCDLEGNIPATSASDKFDFYTCSQKFAKFFK